MEARMHRKLLFVLLPLVLFPMVLSAQVGKLSGTVTDETTGEPLIGANILVDGYSRGAATDVDGGYVILNVPIGKITLVVSYMGYNKLTIENILIRSDETTMKFFHYLQSVKAQQILSRYGFTPAL